jgi:hypothetical protein
VSFDYTTVDGSAIAEDAYVPTTGRAQIRPGKTTATISVDVVGDTVVEETEEFFVNLSEPTGATLANARGTATVADAAQEGFSAGDNSVTEGNTATTPLRITVTLADIHAQPVTADYAVSDASAEAGSDYVAAAGTLTFAPGQRDAQITVAVMGDTVVEPTETFTVALANPTNGVPLAKARGTGTIVDDDAPPAEPPLLPPLPTLLALAPFALPPPPPPPSPLTQPMTQAQAQAQQQAQQQAQEQAQQQAQQQAQAQAQAQAQGQAQAQAQGQAQPGMMAERQREIQVERAVFKEGGGQQHLASARETSPVPPAALAWAASVIGLGIGLVWRRGERAPVQDFVPLGSRSGPKASRRRRRRSGR